MTDEQFAEYLALVHERSGVECKGPGQRQMVGVSGTLLSKLRSRGYWQTVVRPGRFARKAIPSMVTLSSLLEKARCACAAGIFRTWG